MSKNKIESCKAASRKFFEKSNILVDEDSKTSGQSVWLVTSYSFAYDDEPLAGPGQIEHPTWDNPGGILPIKLEQTSGE